MKKLKQLFSRNSSIRKKLIIVSFLLLSVPLLFTSIVTYQKSKSSLDELGAVNLKNNVEMILILIDSYNDQVEQGHLTLEEAQDEVKNTVLGEQDAEGNRPMNPNLELGENGFIFFLDNDGVQVAAKNLEGENLWEDEDADGVKFVQEIIKTGNEGGGLTYYEWPSPDNENVILPNVTYAKTDPHWGWTVNAGAYMMDFNEPATEILQLSAVVVGLSIIVGGIVIWLLASSLSNPIKLVTEHLKYLADGDLTKENIHIRSKDETGELAKALNVLQDKLLDVITNLAGASDVISDQSAVLYTSSNEVKQGSEQVATTMVEIAKGSESQAEHSNHLSEMMTTFTEKVSETNQHGETIKHASEQVLSMTKEGTQLMENSTEQMKVIDKIVQEAVQKVEGLDAHSQEISALVSVIHDIAEQTNLLALNAAIEAARAGEHGQGFAVVADEVRKLAEQVSDSVANITSIVSSIQAETSNVTGSLQTGYKEVEEGTHQIQTTEVTFQNISKAVTEMVDNIQVIARNLADIATNSQDMSESITEIASISEESAAGIEETSAQSEEATSLMDEVENNSKELEELAENLSELVSEFKWKN